MSPHQTATKIVAKFLGCPEEQAAAGQLASQICDAIQAASNAELERRRERVANLEAALKAIRDSKALSFDATSHNAEEAGALTWVACNVCEWTGPREKFEHLPDCPFSIAEAALSGATSALDAVVAEAKAEGRREGRVETFLDGAKCAQKAGAWQAETELLKRAQDEKMTMLLAEQAKEGGDAD